MKDIENSQILSFLFFLFLKGYFAEGCLRGAWCPRLHKVGRCKSKAVNFFASQV